MIPQGCLKHTAEWKGKNQISVKWKYKQNQQSSAQRPDQLVWFTNYVQRFYDIKLIVKKIEGRRFSDWEREFQAVQGGEKEHILLNGRLIKIIKFLIAKLKFYFLDFYEFFQ